MSKTTQTVRLTTAQALTRFLINQHVELDDGSELPLFAGVWAIFGHGNVAGIGEALYQVQDQLPTYRGHNEQSMALAAIAFAKARQRHTARPPARQSSSALLVPFMHWSACLQCRVCAVGWAPAP